MHCFKFQTDTLKSNRQEEQIESNRGGAEKEEKDLLFKGSRMTQHSGAVFLVRVVLLLSPRLGD